MAAKGGEVEKYKGLMNALSLSSSSSAVEILNYLQGAFSEMLEDELFCKTGDVRRIYGY